MSKRVERSDKGIIKNGSLYGYTSLMNFCKKNDIKLISEHTVEKTNRETMIKGYCVRCGDVFEKKFRAMMPVNKKTKEITLGAYCEKCTTDNSVKKVKDTCTINYGTTNVSQVQSVKEARIITNNEKYGVDYTQSNPEVRAKRDATDRENHGGKRYLETPECQERNKAINMERRGYEYPSQCPIVKAKCKKTYQEKYGYDYYILSPEFQERYKATLLERYGVEHPMHSQEIAKRCLKNSYKTKIYVSESGKEYNYQGYEHFMIKHLIDSGISEDDIINESGDVPFINWTDENGKTHFHIVDMFIPSKNKCIEVKSEWTILRQGESNVRAKQAAAKALGYDYEIWIFNNKGHALDIWY